MSVRAVGLEKRFGEISVVSGVSFDVRAGEVVTLLGPSGCGKTTVLRMVAGLEAPSAGEIRIGERVVNSGSGQRAVFVPPHERGVGMVFQSYALWPHKTVFGNVSFPLAIRRLSKAEIGEKVSEALKLVGLEALRDRYPSELSGGQQQRVALARAVVMRPSVLLLDEPLSNLDAKLREQMRRELKALQSRLGLTMLYVTHDRLEALELSDRMAILDGGRLIQFGTPEEVRRKPVNEFVAHFIS